MWCDLLVFLSLSLFSAEFTRSTQSINELKPLIQPILWLWIVNSLLVCFRLHIHLSHWQNKYKRFVTHCVTSAIFIVQMEMRVFMCSFFLVLCLDVLIEQQILISLHFNTTFQIWYFLILKLIVRFVYGLNKWNML